MILKFFHYYSVTHVNILKKNSIKNLTIFLSFYYLTFCYQNNINIIFFSFGI